MSNNFVTLTHNKIKEKFSNYKREVGGILSIWSQVIGESLNSLSKQLDLAKNSMFSYTSLSGDELDLRASEFYLSRIQPTISSGEILVYKDGENDEVIQSRLFLKGGYWSLRYAFPLSAASLLLWVVSLHAIDKKQVANYLYTPREAEALLKGGVQRLYLGNLKVGEHELVALFAGKGPHERDYQRGATLKFEKGIGAKYLELKINDRQGKQQPEFEIKDWE